MLPNPFYKYSVHPLKVKLRAKTHRNPIHRYNVDQEHFFRLIHRKTFSFTASRMLEVCPPNFQFRCQSWREKNRRESLTGRWGKAGGKVKPMVIRVRRKARTRWLLVNREAIFAPFNRHWHQFRTKQTAPHVLIENNFPISWGPTRNRFLWANRIKFYRNFIIERCELVAWFASRSPLFTRHKENCAIAIN